MEQLAHFVTKSFEYNNNNRVLDVLNLTTKSGIFDHLKSNDSMDTLSNLESDDNDADSVDIDITDVSSNDGNDSNKIHNENDNNNINVIRQLSPPKKLNKENHKQLTKNWLISDTPKKKCDNGSYKIQKKKKCIAMPTAMEFFRVHHTITITTFFCKESFTLHYFLKYHDYLFKQQILIKLLLTNRFLFF